MWFQINRARRWHTIIPYCSLSCALRIAIHGLWGGLKKPIILCSLYVLDART